MRDADIVANLQANEVVWVNSSPRSWRWHGVILGSNAREAHSTMRRINLPEAPQSVKYVRAKLVIKEDILRSNKVHFKSLLADERIS